MSVLGSLVKAAAGILPAKKNAAPPPDTVVKKTPPPPQPITTELLLAWQPSPVNATLLTAYKPGTDPSNPNNILAVRVRSNVNFMRHMRLQVRQSGPGQYDLVGPLPRWKGRW